MGEDKRGLLDYFKPRYRDIFLGGIASGVGLDRLAIYLLGKYKEEKAKEQAEFAKTVVSEMDKYLKENDKKPQA